MQQKRAPGAPVQGPGGDGDFAVDPMRLGLSRGGGSPLPRILLAKMEAAFGADFSAVRVHVGPQPARIGALAFTTGDDLYFAPGQYQPESVRGQQLIGHELAHVVQQRAGRVRGAGNGTWVVQNRALEAEADRLGARAAAHVVQPRRAAGASSPSSSAPATASAPRALVQLSKGGNRRMGRDNGRRQAERAAHQDRQARRNQPVGRLAQLLFAPVVVQPPPAAAAAAAAAAPAQPPAQLQPPAQVLQIPQGWPALPALPMPPVVRAPRGDRALAEAMALWEVVEAQAEADLWARDAVLRAELWAALRRAQEIRLAEARFVKVHNRLTLVAFMQSEDAPLLFDGGEIAKIMGASNKGILKYPEIAKGLFSFSKYCEGLPAVAVTESKFSGGASAGFGGGPKAKGGGVTGHRDRKFDAGEGERWHIHFRDHVKFRNGPRINIKGRKKAAVLSALAAMVQNNPGLGAGLNVASLAQCTAWINDNMS